MSLPSIYIPAPMNTKQPRKYRGSTHTVDGSRCLAVRYTPKEIEILDAAKAKLKMSFSEFTRWVTLCAAKAVTDGYVDQSTGTRVHPSLDL